MNTLTLNWIEFFHNANFNLEIMQQTFKHISGLSAGMGITIETFSRNTNTPHSVAVSVIKSLIKSKLLNPNFICPGCNEKININGENLFFCVRCDDYINLSTIKIAYVNASASLTNIFKNNIDDSNYEKNASIISEKISAGNYLYYLITDIENSQTQQRTNPEKYLSVLNQLWSELWPKVMRSSIKASLPLMARGDSVSWIFTDKEDILNAINEIALFLCVNQIAVLTVYASDISISDLTRNPIMKSLDKKWDLNTPSITDLYRKTNFIPKIWKKATGYIIKYCLFDELINIPANNKFIFLRSCVKNTYKVTDKHKNHYEGKCIAGYCNTEMLESTKEPPNAQT